MSDGQLQSQSGESGSYKSKAPKKRGRPKGSRTKKLDIVKDYPIGCPSCHSTEFKVRETIRQRDIVHSIAGAMYNRSTWRRVQCKDCGQIYIRVSHRIMAQ